MIVDNWVRQHAQKTIFTLVFCIMTSVGLVTPQVSQAAGNNEWRQAFRDLKKQDIGAWRDFRKSKCSGVARRSCKKKFVAANSKAVPELDPNHLGAALLLTAGGVLVATGRRKKLDG